MTSALAALGDLVELLPHRNFTKVQETVIPSLLSCNENVVVAAPTGSGKTLLLEVAMLKLFRHRLPLRNRTRELDKAQLDSTATPKAVYICPIKALANEKYHHWRQMFAPLSVVIETGDQERGRQQQQQQQGCAAPQRIGGGKDDASGGVGPSDDHDDDDDALTCVATADIVITTPERWDSITRRWKERTVLAIVHSVGLLLLDEVHTVHEDRGAALEAVVSRMKAIKAQQAALHPAAAGVPALPATAASPAVCGSSIRFVAVSGTLPNIEDFAEWLHVRQGMAFAFSAEDRPVPLTIKVLGFPSDSNNPFAFDRFLCFKLFGLIRQHSQGRPTIVFCASRKETAAAAQRLVSEIHAQAARSRGAGGDGVAADTALEPSQEVLALANTANDKQLRQCLLLGVAYHHAAMTTHDRQLVEDMFRQQYIAAVCTTTTLALGVNLPAHLVIVKGTTFFKSGRRDDIPLSEAAQMCGRAGRPGLDDHGVALVLTTEKKVGLYENLIHGSVYTTVESQLHRSMIEHVNAEVALRTIHSFATGLDWIRTTFFWIRLGKYPQHYGLTFATKADELAFQPHVFAERLMHRVLTALYEQECVDVRCSGGGGVGDHSRVVANEPSQDRSLFRLPDATVESTRIGRSMARLYILFDTVKVFNDDVRGRVTKQRGLRCGGVSAGGHDGGEGAMVAGEEEVDGGEEAPDDDPAVDQTHGPVPSPNDPQQHGTAATTGDAAGVPSSPLRTAPPRLFPQGGAPLHLQRPFRLQDVLALCCHSAEFEDIGLRQGDKGPLNEMNKVVKFPIKGGHKGGREVRENWHKSYVLIQGQLSQVTIAEVSLRNDFTRLWAVVPRVVRFLSDYARFTGSYSFCRFADLLGRCVEQRVWADGLVLKQLNGVSDAVARSLFRAGFDDFQSVRVADPRKLEAVCGRLPPYGSQLQAQVHGIPRCHVTVAPAPQPSTAAGLRYQVCIVPTPGGGSNDDASAKAAAANAKHYAAQRWRRVARNVLLLAGAPRADCVLLLRYVPVDTILHGAEETRFEFTVPAAVVAAARFAGVESTIEINLVVGRWVGADVSLSIPLYEPPPVAAAAVGSASADPTHAEGTKSSAAMADRCITDFMSSRKNKTHGKATKMQAVMERLQHSPHTVDEERQPAMDLDARDETGSLAAEVLRARDAFDTMMEDFQYIRGESRVPSPRIRGAAVTQSRTGVCRATPKKEAVRAEPEAAGATAVSSADGPVDAAAVTATPRRREQDDPPGKRQRAADSDTRPPLTREEPATVARRVNFGDTMPEAPPRTATVRLRRAASPEPRYADDAGLPPSLPSERTLTHGARHAHHLHDPYAVPFFQDCGGEMCYPAATSYAAPHGWRPSAPSSSSSSAFCAPQGYDAFGSQLTPRGAWVGAPAPRPPPPPCVDGYLQNAFPHPFSSGNEIAAPPQHSHRPSRGGGRFHFNVQVNSASRPDCPRQGPCYGSNDLAAQQHRAPFQHAPQERLPPPPPPHLVNPFLCDNARCGQVVSYDGVAPPAGGVYGGGGMWSGRGQEHQSLSLAYHGDVDRSGYPLSYTRQTYQSAPRASVSLYDPTAAPRYGQYSQHGGVQTRPLHLDNLAYHDVRPPCTASIQNSWW